MAKDYTAMLHLGRHIPSPYNDYDRYNKMAKTIRYKYLRILRKGIVRRVVSDLNKLNDKLFVQQ